MNRPWMPLYVADYLADTAHLSVAESGAYLHLIMHYWTQGKLPNDERAIQRITRMTARQWSQSRDLLRSLFGDEWRHKRIDHELAQAAEISRKRSASAQQKHSKSTAHAEQLDTHARASSPSQSQLQTESKTDSRAVASATRPVHEQEFEEFWKAYPKREGANPKAPARKAFIAAVKAGAEAAAIIAGARACTSKDRDKIGTPYIPQAVKWLRDRRWEDYAATGPPAGQPAYLTPPPGQPTLEEFRRKFNGPAQTTEVRRDTGVGEDGADQPEKLQLPSRGTLRRA